MTSLKRFLAITLIMALAQGYASTATSVPTVESPAATLAVSQSAYYIYLAGPEVFLPNPIGAGAANKAATDTRSINVTIS